MRLDAGLVRQRDEGVVVGFGAGTPNVDLGVNPRGRAEEAERLVDEVTAEVVEQSAGLLYVARFAPAA